MNRNVLTMKLPGVTYYDYFEYYGKRYQIGTVVMLNEPYNSKFSRTETIIFKHCKDCGTDYYYISSKCNLNKDIVWHKLSVSPDKFIKEIVENPSISMNMLQKPVQYERDFENEEVKFGWFIYIIVMLGLIIFKDAWMGWIAVTIYFFRWRKKKLIK